MTKNKINPFFSVWTVCYERLKIGPLRHYKEGEEVEAFIRLNEPSLLNFIKQSQ